MANTKIPSELIADSSITAAKLADGTITTADIADSNVTTAKIADSNVTTAKIGDAQVTTAKITDANVTTVKIADDAVTTAKMASNSVTSDTIASGITLAGTTTLSSHLVMGDNDIIKVGDSSDLQIYHNGSFSVIKEAGTGDLEIQTNGSEIQLTGNAGTDYMLRAISNGAVKLYYNNSTKLATTSTGIDVTGTLTLADIASSGYLQLTANDVDFIVRDTTDSPTNFIWRDHSASKLYLGTPAAEVTIRSDAIIDTGYKIGIGTTSPSFPLHSVNASTSYLMAETTGTGTSAGFRMKGDASADFTLFTTQGTNQFAIYDNSNTAQRLTIDSSGNVGIGTSNPIENLDVSGYQGISVNNNYAHMGSTVSGAMAIFGHNIKSDSGANTIKSANTGYHSSMIKMYYDEGITFHATSGTQSAGADFYNISGTTNELMRITNAGNVGIGTSNPLGKFVVSNSGAEGFEVFPGSASGQNSFQHYNRSGSAYLRNRNIASEFTFNLSGASEDAVIFKSDGKVAINHGLGGGSINSQFNVFADGEAIRLDGTANTSRTLRFRNAATNGSGNAIITSDGILQIKTEDANAHIYINSVRDIAMQTTSLNGTAGNFTFSSYNTEIMRIDGGNNRVGIGEITPDDTLHVNNAGGAARIRIGSGNDAYYTQKGYLGDTWVFGSGETGDVVTNTISGGAFTSSNTGGAFVWKIATSGGTPAEKMRILSTGQIVTGGLTSTSAALHLYSDNSWSGILTLQSQAAANATAQIAFMSRDSSNVNDDAYIKYNNSGGTTTNQFDFYPSNQRTFSMSRDGSTFYGDTGTNQGIGKFIGSVAPHNAGNRYIHVQLSTNYNEMVHIFVHGYSYTSALIEGACAFYFYNNNNQTTLYDGRYSGSIVAGHCNSSNNYSEIVIDTLGTNTTNRWGNVTIYGGQDNIISYHHTEIVQVSYTNSTARVFT